MNLEQDATNGTSFHSFITANTAMFSLILGVISMLLTLSFPIEVYIVDFLYPILLPLMALAILFGVGAIIAGLQSTKKPKCWKTIMGIIFGLIAIIVNMGIIICALVFPPSF